MAGGRIVPVKKYSFRLLKISGRVPFYAGVTENLFLQCEFPCTTK